MQWDKNKGWRIPIGEPMMVETDGGEKLTLTLTSASPVINPLPLQEVPPTDYVRYPPPLATYDEILASPTLFKKTLEKFHADMGTKLTNPTVGGQLLDLHKLFVLVTSRGGFCKTHKEKTWTEVHGDFEFRASATNSSSILRKYYFSLLFHYEQVYYLRAEVWSSSELETLQMAAFPKKNRRQPEAGSSSACRAASKRPAVSEPEVATSPVEIPNPQVLGTVESKFDVGYYITGKLGLETMHGVLYHIPQQPAEPAKRTRRSKRESPTEQNPDTSAAGTSAAAGKKTRRKRRKKTKKAKDPNEPKGSKSAYNYFFSYEYDRLREKYSGIENGNQDILNEIGTNWRELSEEQRAPFEEKAKEDKVRHEREMAAYNARLMAPGQIAIHMLPLHPHSSPGTTAEGASSSQYEEANVELSLGRTMPDLNMVDLDGAAEGSSALWRPRAMDTVVRPSLMD